MNEHPRQLPRSITLHDANGEMRTITDHAEIAALINKLSPEGRRGLDALSAAVEDALLRVMEREAQRDRAMLEQDSVTGDAPLQGTAEALQRPNEELRRGL